MTTYKVWLAEDDAPTADATPLHEYESDYVPEFEDTATARAFAERRFAEENKDYGYVSEAGIIWQNDVFGWATAVSTPESWAPAAKHDGEHEFRVTYQILSV